MADKSIDFCVPFYTEDILTIAPGSVLIAHPAMIWTIVFSVELSGTYVVNFSDDATGYNHAHKIGKEVIVGPNSDWNGFGKGLPVTRGLSAICNLVGLDVWGLAE